MKPSASNIPPHSHPYAPDCHPREGGDPSFTPKSHTVDYHYLALIQLEAAIRHYLSETLEGYICAITLSGASEDILGKLLNDQNRQHILKELVAKLSIAFSMGEKEIVTCLNLARDILKHLKTDFCGYDWDPELFARIMIFRALFNFAYLTDKKTKTMDDFINFIETRMPDARLRGHDPIGESERA